MRTALALLAVMTAAGCAHQAAKPSTYSDVNLDPPVATFVAVGVGDAIETGLLAQKLGVKPVRVEGTTLYLIDDPQIRARLTEFGYEPRQVNAHEIVQRVVRISRDGAAPQGDLARYALRVINRERDHWVVSGSLSALRGAVADGYRITPVRDPEPRPRQIRVVVPRPAEVVRLGGLMDIYGVIQPKERGGAAIVGGAAFDVSIDQIRALGFEVEILPPPRRNQGITP